jgi:hypothetical protein
MNFTFLHCLITRAKRTADVTQHAVDVTPCLLAFLLAVAIQPFRFARQGNVKRGLFGSLVAVGTLALAGTLALGESTAS